VLIYLSKFILKKHGIFLKPFNLFFPKIYLGVRRDLRIVFELLSICMIKAQVNENRFCHTFTKHAIMHKYGQGTVVMGIGKTN